MKEYYTDCYLLKSYNVGEADKLFVLFSKDFGKISARAKGIRKPAAKLKGIMQPFTAITIRLIKGRKVETIIGAQNKHIYTFSANNINATIAAYQLLEATMHIMAESQANNNVYKLITNCFSSLDKNISAKLVIVYGLYQLLKHVGQAPEITKLEIAPQYYFEYDNGSIVSSRPNSHYGLISESEIKLWRLLNEYHLSTLSQLKNIDIELNNTKRLLEKYFQYHFELNFKSTVLLD